LAVALLAVFVATDRYVTRRRQQVSFQQCHRLSYAFKLRKLGSKAEN
jgi:hypothetical protein